MKFGFNFSSFPSGTKLEDAFRQIHDVGFTGYEAAITDEGVLGLDVGKSSLAGAKRLAEQYDIDICTVSYSGKRPRILTDNNPRYREETKEVMRYLVDSAVYLGAESILVFPGVVGIGDAMPKEDIVPYEVAYERALEGFLELKDYAKDAGVTIGLENWWVKFLLSPIEFRDFLDTIDSPYVKACMDVGNVIATGYPEDWIRILAHRMIKVHLKDYRFTPGGMNGYVDLLAGDVNFPEVVKALNEVQYDGYCIAETRPYKYYNEQQIINTAASIRRIFSAEDTVQ